MFLRTTKPHPPGSSFQFEFRIAGGQLLIRGVAEVVWTRDARLSDSEPPGMGVRFVSLDRNGQKIIRWLVERNFAGGGVGFDPERPSGPAL